VGGLGMDNSETVHHFDPMDYVGFWKRVMASILDFLVMIIPAVLIYFLSHSLATSMHSEIPIILQYILFLAFDIFMIVRFGGSPGKLILKIRIVNEQGNYPTLKEALVRNVFRIISVLITMVIGVSSYEFTVISSYFSLWESLASDLNGILGLIMLADYLCVALNSRKRALHDMMAGTYVVEKSAI
jgi:uncharacterized RDD family membrane protein YckC